MRSGYRRNLTLGIARAVDRDDPAELAGALARLLSDRLLRERLAANAWYRAREDFDLPQARARFAELLALDAPAGG